MAVSRTIFLLIGVLHLGNEVLGQSDLRSALAAIDRRQKELADYEEQQQYGINPYGRPDDVSFLSNSAEGRGYEKVYLDDNDFEPISKRFTSSFREKQDDDEERQMEEFARNFYNNLESSGMPGGSDKNYLRDLWDRYYGNDISYTNNALVKRYYPTYGVENIGVRKRGRYMNFEDEPIYSIHHHIPRDDESDYQINNLRNHYIHGKSFNQARNPYASDNRVMVTKRSSIQNYEQKRSVKKQTDPKVEKDLSDIFGNEQQLEIMNNKLTDADFTTQKPENVKISEDSPPPRKIEKKDRPKMDVGKDVDINKEIFAPVAPQNNEPLQLKKKSIDWSDYFGLDRRKKSEPNNNNLDKEWLMERYHKAIEITTKKRNSELPLQSFRNHETRSSKADDSYKEEEKINEMDRKFEKMEDQIVEDALKYTGAHQVEGDSQEVQRVKDNIMSRLVQAYNIEKMRNALEEYKKQMTKARKEVDKPRAEGKLFPEYTLEEKRNSVPRKEAFDNSGKADASNDIKCTTSADCHEQNYKTPADIIDNHFTTFECPVIERACNDVASIIGHYGHAFEPACKIHQLCLLCAFELCLDDEECRKESRRSLGYLSDINKSLQAQAALANKCEMQCPYPNLLSK